MSKLTALLQFLLALAGFHLGGTHFIDRIRVDGIDTLYSKAQVEDGVARFTCVGSASGVCHYTLFDTDCPPAPHAGANGHCTPRPLKHFAVASGDSEQITGLPDFHLCVGTGGASPTPDCKVPKPIARR